MAKITYLLGAGASANTIPVVNNMHKRLIEVISFLGNYTPSTKISSVYSVLADEQKETLKLIIDELKWLWKESGNYYTIDTLAKKYYLINDDIKLKKLKRALILFFCIEQCLNIKSFSDSSNGYNFLKEQIDKRYGSFIASISRKRYPIAISGGEQMNNNSNFELNNNIKILSWNYDMQFELALKLLDKKKIESIKSQCQIFPNKYTINEAYNNPLKSEYFAMVKLNGDANWYLNSKPHLIGDWTILDALKDSTDEEELLKDFMEKFKESDFEQDLRNINLTSPFLSFNFAWENDANFKEKYHGHPINLQIAQSIAVETEILVVIGYSFPIFNREIDKLIINDMRKLKKIYIQDKEPNKIKSTMLNAFEIIEETEIKNQYDGQLTLYNNRGPVSFMTENNTNQFIIPYELT